MFLLDECKQNHHIISSLTNLIVHKFAGSEKVVNKQREEFYVTVLKL